MKKYIPLLAGLCMLLSACEEVYKADLDEVENLLVIEALLTNNASVNYVKLSKTQNFYADKSIKSVAGATVTISDKSGNSYSLSESSTGYFLPDFSAVPGETYRIKVEAEGEIYESNYELMPETVSVDSIYVQSDKITTYIYDDYGVPMAKELTGMKVFADLPVSENMKYYRFSLPRTMEYVIIPPALFGPPPPPIWVWKNFKQSGVFPIHGPATYGNENSLTKRELIFLQTNIRNFVDPKLVDSDTTVFMIGWIVDMSIFGMNEKSYKFYKSVNAQLEADGKLFDPVYAQLVPNFTCTSNPEKRAVGYFEVSSYAHRRFFAMAIPNSNITYFHYVEQPLPIPASGQEEATNPPAFWEDR